ncbi:cytochrome c oxidase assembly protein COX16 homolog, mitochondrial isoform X1 [Hyperolius riggenbachi]|uniref:cytochrome c oxidase assembly protein COX16 homolog, mitochondrial isoform X1 n=1 Tax=Hyperolius riggenbachi TaxID=752182 RepID=UPI0035A2CAC3
MKMLNLSKIIQAFKTNDTLRYGVPMMLLVVGGSFGLREFTQIRYDSQKLKSTVDPELVKQLKSKEKETTLESEYEMFADSKAPYSQAPKEDASRITDTAKHSGALPWLLVRLKFQQHVTV